jgi:hypothetical protein
MIAERGVLDLSVGSRLVLNGQEWAVASFLPHLGRVRLRNARGEELATTVRVLINHPDCRPVASTAGLAAYNRGRQLAGLDDLTDHQRDIVALRRM